MRLVIPPPDPFDVFIALDPSMLQAEQRLRAWAQIPTGGLITGESGVGKSLAARVLHIAAGLAHAPLVTLRPDEPAGPASQWATTLRDGGTLVLDHLERWSIGAQQAVTQRLPSIAAAERLQVLGLSRFSEPRLRLEARLHSSLAQRWASRHIALPPLRARPDDLFPLVRAMLRRAGRASVRLEPQAWRALSAHGWPDNVRELRQVVDASLVRVTDDRLYARHLRLEPLAPPALEAVADDTFEAMRRSVDTWYLRRLLHQTGGNLSEAARRAGCTRKVLRERLRRHGLYAEHIRTRAGDGPYTASEPMLVGRARPEAGGDGSVARDVTLWRYRIEPRRATPRARALCATGSPTPARSLRRGPTADGDAAPAAPAAPTAPGLRPRRPGTRSPSAPT